MEQLHERLTWASQAYLEMARDVLCWIHSDDTLRGQTFLQTVDRIHRAQAELTALERRIRDEKVCRP